MKFGEELVSSRQFDVYSLDCDVQINDAMFIRKVRVLS